MNREHPRPLFRRPQWIDLDGEWELGAGPEPLFDRRIQVPFCPESQASGIGRHLGDVLWYRRRFDAPVAERLLLHLGAVDYRATVWVNGVEVARHEGGHVPFAADITEMTRGRDNEVVVRAEDPRHDRTIPRGKQWWGDQPEGIFYTPTTGIWQTVWLEPVAAARITDLRLRPDLEGGALEFEVAAPGEVELVASLDGEVAGRWSGPAGLGRMPLEPVAAWHPDAPRLYDLEISCGPDTVASYFGLRTIEARDGRVWLNGERLLQRLVLDQGYFPGGLLTAASDAELRRDIELAKAFGFNGARKHQKIEDPRWLSLADRLGFLVWAEMPSFHEHSPHAEARLAAEWQEAVRRDRDHPCIVAWVPANESFGLDGMEEAARAAFLDGLYRLTHVLDGTRPVVSNDGWEHATTDLCTIHDYGPPPEFATRYRALDSTLATGSNGRATFLPGHTYAGQPVLVSEFGGLRVAGPGGWGWLEVANQEAFAASYGALLEGMLGPGPVEGFCYTQLTDVEQEQNGLLTADRLPKVDPARLAPLTRISKT
jgi:glycosyl hydrolase family 2